MGLAKHVAHRAVYWQVFANKIFWKTVIVLKKHHHMHTI